MRVSEANLIELCVNGKSDIVDGPFGSNLKSEHFISEGIPTLKIQNIKEFNILKTNLSYVSPSKFKELSRHSFKRGDIVLTKLGDPLGAAAIVDDLEEGLIVADLVRIRINQEIIDTKFLCYLLNSPSIKVQINSQSKGATRPRIKLSVIRDLRITYPPLSEQQRIVAKLDDAFSEIDKILEMKRKQLSENKKLFKSLLDGCYHNIFESMKIGDLGQVSSGGTPSSNNQDYWEGNIQWYSSGELNNKFTEKSIKRITNEGLRNSNAKVFPKGSLLVGMYDTAAMKMSILTEESTFNQAIVGIAPNKFVSSEYLFFTLNYLRESILKHRRGVRQQNLSLAKIKNIEIPVPEIKKQNSLVAKLNFITQQTTIYQEYLSSIIDNLLALKLAFLSNEIKVEFK